MCICINLKMIGNTKLYYGKSQMIGKTMYNYKTCFHKAQCDFRIVWLQFTNKLNHLKYLSLYGNVFKMQ